MAARPSAEDPSLVKATVFVPESKREHYLGKVRAYGQEDNVRFEKDDEGNFLLDEAGDRVEKSRRPKNEALVAALEAARIADAESLYTDDLRLFPEAGRDVWWEMWLRQDSLPILEHVADQLDVAIHEHSVIFAEREVVLARAAPEAGCCFRRWKPWS